MTRGLFGALLGIAIALRVLASAGLMPALAHGQLTVVACPDAGDDAPLAIGAPHHHHHGTPSHVHSTCPYAAASWLSFVGSDFTPLSAVLIYLFAWLALATPATAVPEPRYLRPPLRGPPLLA